MAKAVNTVAVLPEITLTVDDESYLVRAFPATTGLEYLDKIIETNFKLDPATIKKMIVSSVSKDGKEITNTSFDIIFARKTNHLTKLVGEIIKFNYEDVFNEAVGEEDE